MFERGVEAVPLSVDLWMHYLGFTTAVQGEGTEGKEAIRRLPLPPHWACLMNIISSTEFTIGVTQGAYILCRAFLHRQIFTHGLCGANAATLSNVLLTLYDVFISAKSSNVLNKCVSFTLSLTASQCDACMCVYVCICHSLLHNGQCVACFNLAGVTASAW